VLFLKSYTDQLNFSTLFNMLHSDLPQIPELNEARVKYPVLVRKIEIFEDWFKRQYSKQVLKCKKVSSVVHKKRVNVVKLRELLLYAFILLIES